MCSNVKDTEDHKGPAAQQMSKRGPIFIVDSKDVLESLPTLAPSSAGNIFAHNICLITMHKVKPD